MTHTRTDCTMSRSKCQPHTLAQAIHCDARHAEIDSRSVVERLGVGLDWYYKVTADTGRALAPAWLLLGVASVTRRTSAIAYLAREAGLITFSPDFAPGSVLSRALSPMARSFARFCEAFEAAHEDGIYTVDEAHDLTQRAHEHAAELFARVNAVRRAAGLDVETFSTGEVSA